MKLLRAINQQLVHPISVIPLVFFRVAYGLVLLWEVWRYFKFTRIERYYIQPEFFFSYYGFEWIMPMPGNGMFLVFHMLGALSVCLILGIGYRVTTTLIWLIFTYIFLLDPTQYLNHFYLMSWLCFWMIFLPTHRAFSIEAWVRPEIYREKVPAWSLYVLRGQMALVYFWGGVAKLNGDWLRAQPMTMWMQDRADMPILGSILTLPYMEWVFSYGGLLLDLFIVPALLWRRTRIPALVVAIGFHLINAAMFNIGIFPWLAIGATLLFLPPAWFSRFVPLRPTEITEKTTRLHPALIGLLVGCLALQTWLPLRHFFYDNDVNWTEEGHNLAWHMKLRDKDGSIGFYGYADGILWQLDLSEYLSSRQITQMAHRPDMLLEFAYYIEGRISRDYTDRAVHTWTMFSLNGRPFQLMVDPTVDLSEQPRDLVTNEWVVPLLQPFSGDAYPMLLMSWRMDDTLILLNAAEVEFPLSEISLVAGGQIFEGHEWPLDTLQPDECFIASTSQTNWLDVHPPCRVTDAGLTQAASEAIWLRDFDVLTEQNSEIVCREFYCIVALTQLDAVP